jgi:hypothetical protein
MKKLLIGLLVLVSNSIYSQHCPYDGSSIIIAKIHTRENENTIPNLKVSLVKKDKKGKIKKEFILTQSNNFPFLTDEYSLIVGNTFDIENYYLKIESVCEFNNGEWTKYYLTEIKLFENDINGLCDHHDASAKDFKYIDGRVYKPIEIILRKTNCE